MSEKRTTGKPNDKNSGTAVVKESKSDKSSRDRIANAMSHNPKMDESDVKLSIYNHSEEASDEIPSGVDECLVAVQDDDIRDMMRKNASYVSPGSTSKRAKQTAADKKETASTLGSKNK